MASRRLLALADRVSNDPAGFTGSLFGGVIGCAQGFAQATNEHDGLLWRPLLGASLGACTGGVIGLFWKPCLVCGVLVDAGRSLKHQWEQCGDAT